MGSGPAQRAGHVPVLFGQSAAARRAAMPRATLVLLLCALARATIIADQPTLSDRLQKLYEKLDNFSLKTTEPSLDRIGKLYENPVKTSPSNQRIDKLYEKLDRLNSLTPDESNQKYLSDDDEELLDALQEWGMLDDDIGAETRYLQRLKSEDGDYDDEDIDMEDDYAMDDGEDLEPDDREGTTAKTVRFPTPSALNRLERLGTAFSALSVVGDTRSLARESPQIVELENVVSAVDSIAATKERPRILDDTSLTKQEQAGVARAARAYLSAMVPRGKCITPQPRWLSVRHMAPASDTLYRPTCVLLHRCAADTGCCHNEEQVCAPVEGQYVIIPLYLRKPSGLMVARMQFFNHTRCACVSQETLQTVPRAPRRHFQENHSPGQENHNPNQENRIQDRQDKRQVGLLEARERREEVESTSASASQSDWPTNEPKQESETAAPPQLNRCTCPTLFLARASDARCVCVCDWKDLQRRRDCISLSRGREHFGLRDRVCVGTGDCNPPTCEYGAYEKNFGRCPLKRFRKGRFKPGKYLDRTLTGS
ncbi:uncharacterized protein LOC134746066 [Cydia strobilella]|uniref:uncharacterized protein LOC134746066 n=1 Tax=Cydia strobilella TaxID=1100964 RepID=UPI0030076D6F